MLFRFDIVVPLSNGTGWLASHNCGVVLRVVTAVPLSNGTGLVGDGSGIKVRKREKVAEASVFSIFTFANARQW